MSVFFCIIRTFYILVMRIFCMIFCYVLPFTLRSTIYVEFLMVWDESISFFSLYDYNYWGTTTYWKDHSPLLCSYFCHILAECVDTGICLGSPVAFFCLSLCQCTTVFKYSVSVVQGPHQVPEILSLGLWGLETIVIVRIGCSLPYSLSFSHECAEAAWHKIVKQIEYRSS